MKTLKFKWTVSRGRDTYGYNICSLWIEGRKVASCNGGGYDMQGTSFANYLTDNFQEKLLAIQHQANRTYTIKNGEYKSQENKPQKSELFYGMTCEIDFDKKKTKIILDGGCGFSSMEKIANAIGLELRFVDSSKNQTIYLLIEGNEE